MSVSNNKVISNTIELKDRFTNTAKKAYKSTKDLKSELRKTSASVKKTDTTFKKLQRTLKRKIKIKTDISGIKKATNEVKTLRGEIKKLSFARMGGGGRFGSALKLGGRLGAVLKLGGIATAVGGAAAISGGNALFKSGSALEQQKIAMQHFLGGDKQKSESYLKALRSNANATPFETGAVVAAGTRAIQIANGDTKKGMEFVKLAEDMAALNPGKTISDAMEALADANMGEMERLKEFGFKGSKASFDKAGGNINKMVGANGKTLQQMYKGGAEKLSKSGEGIKSTIIGQLKSGFADAGLSFVKRMKPHLSKLVPITKKLSEQLPDMFDRFFDGASKAVEILTPTFESVKNITLSAVKILKPTFEALAPVAKVLGGALGFVAKVAETILVPAFEKIADVAEGISSAVRWLIDPNVSVSKNTINGRTHRTGKRHIRGNATGTNYFAGGMTEINERGAEMIELPSKSKIYPSGKSREIIGRMAKKSMSNASRIVNLSITVNTSGEIDENKLGEILYRKFKEVVPA